MHGKFPAAQWVEHCTANAVRVRMEILYRGTSRFVLSFFFLCYFFFNYFFEASLLFPCYTSLKCWMEYLQAFLHLLASLPFPNALLNRGRVTERCWIFFFFFFCSLFLSIFFRSFVPIPILYQPKKKSGEIFLYSSSCYIT